MDRNLPAGAGRQGGRARQRDDFPIGPLLPPTTWNAGDAKPGYLALPLPADLPPGDYTLTVGVYDPAGGAALADPLPIARYRLPHES